MNKNRKSGHSQPAPWGRLEQRRRQLGALRAAAGIAALGGTLALGAAPTAEAAVVISGTETATVAIPDGNSLQVTNTGSIDTLTGDGVVNATGGSGNFGGILNEGNITSGDSDGIDLTSVALTGGITNSGSITSGTSGFDNGIEIDFSSIDSISNTDTINAQASGIFLRSSLVTGNLANEAGGVINATDFDGITLSFSQVEGNLSNAGNIEAGEHGMVLASSAVVEGNVENSGTIDAGVNGLSVWSSSGVLGNLSNSGTITAVEDGVSVFGDSGVGGTIQNTATGEITTTNGNGISIVGSFANAVANDGTIDADGDGIDIDGGSLVGAVTNTGSISGSDGMDIEESLVASIDNSGTITGQDASLEISSDAEITGGIVNSGSLIGQLDIAGTDGGGGGVDLVNSGTIDIGDSMSQLSGDYTQEAGGMFLLTLGNFSDYTAAPMLIGGDAFIAGDLLLSFTGSESPGFGQRFTLFDIAGTRTGLFGNLAQNAFVGAWGGNDARILYTDEGNIDLYVPEPGSLALLGIGALAGFAGRRQRG
jgi:hypothetical protein